MKYKKFLLIPVLIVAYVFFIDLLVESASFAPSETTEEGQPSGAMQPIGVTASASVSVTRPYLFGLLELPVYISGLGDISSLHNAFFIFMFFLTVIFVVIEWRKRHG